MYSPKIAPALIPRLYQLAKARGIPMTRLVNEFLTGCLDQLEGNTEHADEAGSVATAHLQTKRWCRALAIAKLLFEAEGYHTTYLDEIERCITHSQHLPQVAEGQGRYRPRPRRRQKGAST